MAFQIEFVTFAISANIIPTTAPATKTEVISKRELIPNRCKTAKSGGVY